MSALWPVFAIVAFIWLATRHRRRSRLRRWQPGADYDARYEPRPDYRDDEIARLKERVRALEEIITGDDWRLRRDFDGL